MVLGRYRTRVSCITGFVAGLPLLATADRFSACYCYLFFGYAQKRGAGERSRIGPGRSQLAAGVETTSLFNCLNLSLTLTGFPKPMADEREIPKCGAA
jgi:hypothetical protein